MEFSISSALWVLEVLDIVPPAHLGDAVWCSASDAVWCSAAHLQLLERVLSDDCFKTRVWLNETLHIVDMKQYYLCCVRSL